MQESAGWALHFFPVKFSWTNNSILSIVQNFKIVRIAETFGDKHKSVKKRIKAYLSHTSQQINFRIREKRNN